MWNWIKELFFSDFSMVTAWYMHILVTAKILWSRICHLSFGETKIEDISNSTESHIIHDKIHHIRYNCLGSIFSLLESHTEGLVFLLHPGHTDHTDPKGRFESFAVTPSNDRVLFIYVPLGHSNRKQLTRRRFFKGLRK